MVGGAWALTAGSDRPQPVVVQTPARQASTTVPDALIKALETINRSLTCPDPAGQAAMQRKLEEVVATLPPPPSVAGDEGVVNIHHRITPPQC